MAAIPSRTRADFSIEAYDAGPVTVLEVLGELDLGTGPGLCARLEQVYRRRGSRVLIDLSRLAFCDSTGLRALSGAVQEARFLRVRLRIVPPSLPAAARTFEIAGGAEFLPLVDDAATGLAQLGA